LDQDCDAFRHSAGSEVVRGAILRPSPGENTRMRNTHWMRAVLMGAGLLLTDVAMAAKISVNCHVTYGGETHTHVVQATSDPYAGAPVAIGSYFLLRVIQEHGALPAVKIYTYANLDEGPVPIHVAQYPMPVNANLREPGFTGLQTVYEPVRDGELQYWCARGVAK
jgi:hypothetical protein